MSHLARPGACTVLLLLAASACARPPAADSAADSAARSPAAAAPVAASPAAAAPVAASPAAAERTAPQALPLVTVHKSPSCGCCGLWVEHVHAAGFPVKVVDADNLEPVKSRVGVPFGKGSCHTAEVDGYFIEGHVPADDIKRLLAKRPEGKGLVLPGMPLGSPGMEVPDGTVQAYTVELVKPDGSTVPFAHHPERAAVQSPQR